MSVAIKTKILAMKATVTIGSDRSVHVGPFFTRKAAAILRRLPSLLRSGYFRQASAENPELVSQMIEAADITLSDCNIYEAHCFASPSFEHVRYLPASRHVRNVPALKALLGSELGTGWGYFIPPKDHTEAQSGEP